MGADLWLFRTCWLVLAAMGILIGLSPARWRRRSVGRVAYATALSTVLVAIVSLSWVSEGRVYDPIEGAFAWNFGSYWSVVGGTAALIALSPVIWLRAKRLAYAAAISAALAALVSLSCVVDWKRYHVVQVYFSAINTPAAQGSKSIILESQHGGMRFTYWDFLHRGPMGRSSSALATGTNSLVWNRNSDEHNTSLGSYPGGGYFRGQKGSWIFGPRNGEFIFEVGARDDFLRIVNIVLPDYFVVAILLILPIIWGIRRHRHRGVAGRAKRGECVGCGYLLQGLRAGDEGGAVRCPECGKENAIHADVERVHSPA